MSDRIMTMHPDPTKVGTNISGDKYETVRNAIVDALYKHDELTFKELTNNVRQQLEGTFEGSVSWYVTTIKLDLEARKVIERVPGSSPQRLRLVE